jgi:UrcA family protein
MRFIAKALFAAAAAGAATLALSPVHAELGAPRTQEVRYDDLDLSKPAGKARLERRIAQAARIVCGPDYSGSITTRMAVAECRADAVADARRAMVEVVATAERAVRLAAK